MRKLKLGEIESLNHSKLVVENHPHSPLNLREIFGLKDAPGLQWLRDLPSEEESPLGEVDQDVADNFTQVHPTNHLLIPATGGRGLWSLFKEPSLS